MYEFTSILLLVQHWMLQQQQSSKTLSWDDTIIFAYFLEQLTQLNLTVIYFSLFLKG